MESKKAVVISARVHPGEVVGSWMMRGVLRFLTDPENEEARLLRENFVFKIIPMLNPDGVINGNYRCSLAGCDLNRRWKYPHKSLHPTVFFTKKLIKDLHRERGLIMYCDLHGHSRKQNVFIYGCHNNSKPEETRVFPLMLSKLSNFFDFSSCRFGVQKSKDSTARVSVYKELVTCPNIFTLESTFSGLDQGEQKGMHMNTGMFQNMGRDLCRTLLVYCNIHIPKELEHIFPKQDKNAKPGQKTDMNAMFAQQLKNDKKLIAMGDGDSSGGSDSEPSEDNLPLDQQADIIPIVDKKDQKMLQKIKNEKKLKEQKEKEIREALAKKMVQVFTKKTAPEPPKSPTKRFVVDRQQNFHQKVEEKKEDPPKKKPIMKDAWTQTERSDLERIKRHQQQHALQERLEQQRFRAQHGPQQMKSNPGQFKESVPTRKAPQSQTRQRELFGINVNQDRSPIQVAGMIMNERNVKDLRELNQMPNVNITNIGMDDLPPSHSPTKNQRIANLQQRRGLGQPVLESTNVSSRPAINSQVAYGGMPASLHNRVLSHQLPNTVNPSVLSNPTQQRVAADQQQQHRRSESVQQIFKSNQSPTKVGQIMQQQPQIDQQNYIEQQRQDARSPDRLEIPEPQQQQQHNQITGSKSLNQPYINSGEQYANGGGKASSEQPAASAIINTAQQVLKNVSYSTISMPPTNIPDNRQQIAYGGATSPLKQKSGSIKAMAGSRINGGSAKQGATSNNPTPKEFFSPKRASEQVIPGNVIDDTAKIDHPLQQSVSERMFRQVISGEISPQIVDEKDIEDMKSPNSKSNLENRKKKLSIPKLDTTYKNQAVDYFSQMPSPKQIDEQTSPIDLTGKRVLATETSNANTSPFKPARNVPTTQQTTEARLQEALDDSPDTLMMRKNLINWRATNEISNALSTPMLIEQSSYQLQKPEEFTHLPKIGGGGQKQSSNIRPHEGRPSINLTSPTVLNPEFQFPQQATRSFKPRPSRKSVVDYPTADIQSLHQPQTKTLTQPATINQQQVTSNTPIISNTPMPQHIFLQAPVPKMRSGGGGPHSMKPLQPANTDNPSLHQFPSKPTLKMEDDTSIPPPFSNPIIREAAQRGSGAASEAPSRNRQMLIQPAAVSERIGNARDREEYIKEQERRKGVKNYASNKSNFFNISPRSSSLQQNININSAVLSGLQDDRYAAVRAKPSYPAINDNIGIHQTPMSSFRNNGIGSHGQYQFNQRVYNTDERVNQSWVVLQASSINQESIQNHHNPIRSQLGAERSPMKIQQSQHQIRSPAAAMESQSPKNKNMFMGNIHIMEPNNGGAQQFGRINNNLPHLNSPIKVPQGAKPGLGGSQAVSRDFQSSNHFGGALGNMSPTASQHKQFRGDFSSYISGSNSPTKHIRPYIRQAGLSPLINQEPKAQHQSPPHAIRVKGRHLKEKRPTPGDIIESNVAVQQQQLHFSPPATMRPQNSHALAKDHNNNRNINKMKINRRDQQFRTFDNI